MRIAYTRSANTRSANTGTLLNAIVNVVLYVHALQTTTMMQTKHCHCITITSNDDTVVNDTLCITSVGSSCTRLLLLAICLLSIHNDDDDNDDGDDDDDDRQTLRSGY